MPVILYNLCWVSGGLLSINFRKSSLLIRLKSDHCLHLSTHAHFPNMNPSPSSFFWRLRPAYMTGHRSSTCPSCRGHDPPAQLFYRRVRPDYMTGYRGSTLSSCRGHDPLAQHYFRRLCPKIMTGHRVSTVSSCRGQLPPKSRNCGVILLPSLFSPFPA